MELTPFSSTIRAELRFRLTNSARKGVNTLKKHHVFALLAALLTVLTLSGCAYTPGYLISEDEDWSKSEARDSQNDNPALYQDETAGVTVMYITVGQGNPSENTNYTWKEVNSYPLDYYKSRGVAPYGCEACVQIGDEAGPVLGEFGYGERSANAVIRLRGENASKKPQKSYRITIKDGKGSIADQKVIILNKHSSDPLRIKNRLGFRLLKGLPGFFSVRTQFVHLYVKDKTEGGDGLFVDYGLYTKAEQINKTYLKNHGLDKDGQLYKAVDFDWTRAPALRLATDAQFSQTEFEKYLEIKGNQDNSKLISLLNAVNDPDIPISETVRTYFDKDNIYNWLAFQILTGNRESAYSDYYLYSSQLDDKWYFITGSNDSILSDSYELLQDPEYDCGWRKGIFAYAENRLFSAMLRDESCRAELNSAIENVMRDCLARDIINKAAQEYASYAKPYVYSYPDRIYARVTEDDYDKLISELCTEVTQHYNEFRESLDKPWPFHINPPEATQNGVLLSWEEAFMYDRSEVIYTVELSRDPEFKDMLIENRDISGQSVLSEPLLPGQYFLRVRATAPSGAEQLAFEQYYTESGKTVLGTVCFYVTDNGGIEVSEFDSRE